MPIRSNDSPPSSVGERLNALDAEVSSLTARFQRELERQAAAAAEKARQAALVANNEAALAKASIAAAGGAVGSRPTRSGKARKPARGTTSDGVSRGLDGSHQHQASSSLNNADAASNSSSGQNLNATPGNTKRSKKKKRSALANASNPHHLRNYVPSRLPNSGSGGGGLGGTGPVGGWGGAPLLSVTLAQAAIAFLGPPPVRLLTADRRSRQHSNSNPPFSVPDPAAGMAIIPDEWMCAFCEYDVFFGGESAYRRSVRARKKILRRRRRARERAARAASGAGGGARRADGAGNGATAVGPVNSVTDGGDAETEDEEEEGDVDGEEEDYGPEGPYETAQSPGPRVGIGGGEQVAVGRGADDGAG